jgi:hypothetical protein
VHRLTPLLFVGPAPRVAAVRTWVEALAPPQRALFRAVADRIRKHAPGAVVKIKWGHPVWDQGGPFALFKPAANHVALGFWRGTELNDPDGLLQGSGASVRLVRLREAHELDKLPLGSWIRTAIALNVIKGDT